MENEKATYEFKEQKKKVGGWKGQPPKQWQSRGKIVHIENKFESLGKKTSDKTQGERTKKV